MKIARRPPSLRLQLSLWLLVPLMGLLAFDAWLTYQRAMSAAHTAFDRTLEASLRAMREGIRLREGRLDVDLPNLALELFDDQAGPHIYYRIRDEAGATVTGYDDLPMPAEAPLQLYRTVFYDTEFREQPLRMAAQPLPVHDVGSARTRLVWVLVGESIEPRQLLARDILVGSLLQELVLVTLALGIVWFGVRRGLRPLHRLSDTVAHRGTQLDPIEQNDLPAEMKPLVQALNQYMARLYRMVQARKRFFADAAHQLKTPLAIIQAQSELALRERDGERVREHMRLLHGTVRHASKGLQQLLSLSRLEPDAGYAPTLRPLRLDTLAQGVALEWAPVARGSQVDLGFEQEGPVPLDGQPELLQEMTGNLIDNAIRYAGRGAVVTVRVALSGGMPVLQVVDNGPGIAPAEREAVFRRFYRGESGQSAEGTGLGLSIVREIARLHGASVVLSGTPGGGLTASVRFGMAEAEDEVEDAAEPTASPSPRS